MYATRSADRKLRTAAASPRASTKTTTTPISSSPSAATARRRPPPNKRAPSPDHQELTNNKATEQPRSRHLSKRARSEARVAAREEAARPEAVVDGAPVDAHAPAAAAAAEEVVSNMVAIKKKVRFAEPAVSREERVARRGASQPLPTHIVVAAAAAAAAADEQLVEIDGGAAKSQPECQPEPLPLPQIDEVAALPAPLAAEGTPPSSPEPQPIEEVVGAQQHVGMAAEVVVPHEPEPEPEPAPPPQPDDAAQQAPVEAAAPASRSPEPPNAPHLRAQAPADEDVEMAELELPPLQQPPLSPMQFELWPADTIDDCCAPAASEQQQQQQPLAPAPAPAPAEEHQFEPVEQCEMWAPAEAPPPIYEQQQPAAPVAAAADDVHEEADDDSSSDSSSDSDSCDNFEKLAQINDRNMLKVRDIQARLAAARPPPAAVQPMRAELLELSSLAQQANRAGSSNPPINAADVVEAEPPAAAAEPEPEPEPEPESAAAAELEQQAYDSADEPSLQESGVELTAEEAAAIETDGFVISLAPPPPLVHQTNHLLQITGNPTAFDDADAGKYKASLATNRCWHPPRWNTKMVIGADFMPTNPAALRIVAHVNKVNSKVALTSTVIRKLSAVPNQENVVAMTCLDGRVYHSGIVDRSDGSILVLTAAKLETVLDKIDKESE